MSSSCCANPGVPANEHTALGTETSIDGVRTYKTGSGQQPIVMFSDIYGPDYINSKKLADELASGVNATVYLYDQFDRGAFEPEDPNVMAKFKDWLQQHTPEHAAELGQKVIDNVYNTHNNKKVLVTGYCYGAKPITLLASKQSNKDKISAIVFSHPSLLQPDEVDNMTHHILINQAEQEPIFVPEIRDRWINTLQNKGLLTTYFYPGTAHVCST